MAVVPDASGDTLRQFLIDNVAAGSTVITDGWSGYLPAAKKPYVHERHIVPPEKANELLPGVHRVASLTKRWLLGTHQGSVAPEHLQSYLDEQVLRFNRRGSRSSGLVFYRLMQLAVGHEPVRYREIVKVPTPKRVRPVPPAVKGRTASLERPRAERPWRAA